MILSDFLIDRYKEWKLKRFPYSANLYKILEEEGQNPKAMIISCCDSRVDPNIIFNSNEGDFFIHRNIANLIPPFDSGEIHYGTSAAIDYAITSLKISNIIILGHSNCGGIHHSHKIFSEKKDSDKSPINSWIETIRPAYKLLDKKIDKDIQIKNLEKMSIKNSILNLNNYPNIKSLTIKNKLNIFGFWFEIKSGNLMLFNEENNQFELVS